MNGTALGLAVNSMLPDGTAGSMGRKSSNGVKTLS
ncbi:UNVERIFIED_CONTAM: hypothetical protein ABIC26_003618 [Paenibacillus sp. PvR008]